MNTIESLGPFLGWLGRTSAQAGALIVLIVVVQILLRNKLSARWRHGLWLLLIVRLILPWAPQSAVSIDQLWSTFFTETAQPQMTTIQNNPGHAVNPRRIAKKNHATPAQIRQQSSSSSMKSLAPTLPSPSGAMEPARSRGLLTWLAIAWLAGFAGLLGVVLAQSTMLGIAIRRRRPVTDQALLELFEECKDAMGVTAWVMIAESPAVKSPALFGFIRPRLILPQGAFHELGAERMRHVFMHELAHLKRHDVATNWLMALLQAAHWFNPLIWYGFHRLRADRELVCDSMVLEKMRGQAGQEYGETILRLVENVSQPNRVPALAGILENRAQLEERLTRIAQFDPHGRSLRASALAAILLIALACVGLTARKDKADKEVPQQKIVKAEFVAPHIYDDISNILYFSDPDAIGLWETVDYVGKPEQFTPGKKVYPGGFQLNGLGVYEGGLTSYHWRWTKGFMLNLNGPTKMPYRIQNIAGQSYMFVPDGGKLVVFKKTASIPDSRHPIADGKPLFQNAKIPATGYMSDRGDGSPMLFEHINGTLFKNDPKLIGRWRQVDIVLNIDDFKAGRHPLPNGWMPLGLTVFRGGHTSGCWAWTKGKMLTPGVSVAEPYEIQKIGGRDYLFIENKDALYGILLKKPDYLVFEKIGDAVPETPAHWKAAEGKPVILRAKAQIEPTSHIENGRLIDKTNYPFKPDPNAVGTWKNVDFVHEIDEFRPEEIQWPRYEVVDETFEFGPDGTCQMGNWTKGMILRADTAEHYEIKKLNGQTYMFREWKSGDYTHRQMKPYYKVMQKTGDGTDQSNRHTK